MANEFKELESEIDRQLEEQKTAKGIKTKNCKFLLINYFHLYKFLIFNHFYRLNFTAAALEESDAERFIRESNLNVIEECVGSNPISDEDLTRSKTHRNENALATGLGIIFIFIIN